mmetsp:Transcript_33273/g.56055  ORF Transcript_33273/g.56055 Transcript_33273/m.56055 type:complete len:224 (-) Transcript_33273:1341-2012(-)
MISWPICTSEGLVLAVAFFALTAAAMDETSLMESSMMLRALETFRTATLMAWPISKRLVMASKELTSPSTSGRKQSPWTLGARVIWRDLQEMRSIKPVTIWPALKLSKVGLEVRAVVVSFKSDFLQVTLSRRKAMGLSTETGRSLLTGTSRTERILVLMMPPTTNLAKGFLVVSLSSRASETCNTALTPFPMLILTKALPILKILPLTKTPGARSLIEVRPVS